MDRNIQKNKNLAEMEGKYRGGTRGGGQFQKL